MKKYLGILCLLLVVLLVATGCKAPSPEVEEESPTEAPTPVPTPTFFMPTPEPTVTPRVMTGEVAEPAPESTLLEIDPIDKPTRPPIVFEPFVEKTESAMGITFNVPSYWERDSQNQADNVVVYQEPRNDIRSGMGIQSQLIIQVVNGSAAQTIADAEAYIDALLNSLLDHYKNPDFSSKADNRIKDLGAGRYVTYRVDDFISEDAPAVRMRGRILVVPVDRKLYMVRYICPAEYNSDYEKVYLEIRDSLKEIP